MVITTTRLHAILPSLRSRTRVVPADGELREPASLAPPFRVEATAVAESMNAASRQSRVRNPFPLPSSPRSSLLALALLGAVLARDAAAQTCVSPTPGIVAWWSFDGNVEDIVSTNDGELVGSGASFGAGVVGQAYSSGDTGSLVKVPSAPALNVTALTLEAWIRVDAVDSNHKAIAWRGDPNGHNPTSPLAFDVLGTSLVTTSPGASVTGTSGAGKLMAIIYNGAQPEQILISHSVPFPGPYTHVAFTADGAQMRLYINGVLDAFAAQLHVPLSSDNPLQIGGVAGSSISTLIGSIDELTLYDHALSDSEILALFNAGGSGKCKTFAGNIAYGTGKAGSLGVPLLNSSTLPKIPSLWTLTLDDALPNATAYLLVGFLPASIGFDGGMILVNYFTFLPVPVSPTGDLAIPVQIPDTPVLAGVSAYWQALVSHDPVASGKGWAMSNGLQMLMSFY